MMEGLEAHRMYAIRSGQVWDVTTVGRGRWIAQIRLVKGGRHFACLFLPGDPIARDLREIATVTEWKGWLKRHQCTCC